MIDLYYWPTPNGHKITLFLEEAGLAYTIHPVDIGAGDQFRPEYLEDLAQQQDAGDRRPGARRRRRLPLQRVRVGRDPALPGQQDRQVLRRRRCAAASQVNAVAALADERAGPDDRPVRPLPRLRTRADPVRAATATSAKCCACSACSTSACRTASSSPATTASPTWPCTRGSIPMPRRRWTSTPFANVRRWHAQIAARPAVQRAYALAQQYGANREMTPEMRKILFGTPSPNCMKTLTLRRTVAACLLAMSAAIATVAATPPSPRTPPPRRRS